MNFFYLCIGLVLAFQFCEVIGDSCGMMTSIYQRILGGEEAEEGEWPFVVALYNVHSSTFFCGGTLISNRHVLTAAHCIQAKGSSSKLDPFNIEVLLGTHNLKERNGEYSKTIEIIDIHIHPDWNVYNTKQYDADLAVLVLNRNVSFTDYIRPVCLPSEDANIFGVSGSIVGWGLTENGTHSDIQRKATTKVLEPFYCLVTYPDLAPLSSLRTLCGGDGMPNKGDSGGGLFVLSNLRWVQYGVISVITTSSNTTAVYTNVQMFKDWIVEKIGEPIKPSARWPFVATLYNVQSSAFFCEGTLISDRHVLTAANCIQAKRSPSKLWPRNIEIHLGIQNLQERSEEYSRTIKIVDIHIHPDWDVYSIKHDADLAILVLRETVSFTDYIRPVLLPSDDDIFYGVNGSTVGWDLTENGILGDVPKETKIEVLDFFDCFTIYPYLSEFSSKRMFCGAVKNGAIKEGYAGNGFFVPSGSTWVQFGLLSALIVGDSDSDAIPRPMYTNVKKFKNWIVGKISEPIIATEEWPFIAAIYHVQSSRFLCSGTLISNRHVLTAANCIQGKGSQQKLEPTNIEVLLGMHNLKERNEKYSKTIGIVDIHVHPEWKVYSERYDADLAILVLNETVSFTNYIQPVRLPADSANFDGASGSAVGWVIQQNNTAPYEEIQNEIKIEVAHRFDCFTKHPSLSVVSSSSIRMFCVVVQNGTIESGFAGAGVFFLFDEGWEQYGILSILPTNRDDTIITATLSTNVKLFTKWIVSTISAVTSD